MHVKSDSEELIGINYDINGAKLDGGPLPSTRLNILKHQTQKLLKNNLFQHLSLQERGTKKRKNPYIIQLWDLKNHKIYKK